VCRRRIPIIQPTKRSADPDRSRSAVATTVHLHGPSPGRLLPPQRSDNVVGGHRPHNSRIVKARRGSMLIVLPQPIRANPVMYNMYDTCAVTTAVTRIIRGSHHLVSYV